MPGDALGSAFTREEERRRTDRELGLDDGPSSTERQAYCARELLRGVRDAEEVQDGTGYNRSRGGSACAFTLALD